MALDGDLLPVPDDKTFFDGVEIKNVDNRVETDTAANCAAACQDYVFGQVLTFWPKAN